ncbi:hypothetical protein Trydic_g4552 [Trypoxylus dichotomus]
MICELCQLFGEENGVSWEVRANAEKRAPVAQHMHTSAKIKQTYTDKLKWGSVTVEVQPKANQTCEVTKKQLTEEVDVVGKKIGSRGVKRDKDVYSTHRTTNTLRIKPLRRESSK